MEKMRAEGNNTPQFCFWAFNGEVITVVQQLYERIYKENKYPDLWFYWDGKPLLLYNADPVHDANGGHSAYKDGKHDYSDEVKNFFTLRNMWWGYYEWAGKRFIGTEDNWSFGYSMADSRIKSMTPEQLASKHDGKIEEVAVTPAQHPVTMTDVPMGVGNPGRSATASLSSMNMISRIRPMFLGLAARFPIRKAMEYISRSAGMTLWPRIRSSFT